MNEKNLKIYSAEAKPKLPLLIKRGKHPYNLTLGFETEFSPSNKDWKDYERDGKIPQNKIPDFLHKCFYFA